MADRSTETPRAREMRKLSAAFDRSDETIAEFAVRHGLNPGTFAWWRSQLRRGAAARPESLELIEIDLPRQPEALATGAAAGAFGVALRNGIEVSVPAEFDAAALERLMAVLRRC